jgi:hypothetical protein
MGQPVKLSDELVCDARVTAELSQRSIAGQIEFWAQLGKSLEPILRGDRVLALRQSGAARPLSEAIAGVDTPVGKQQVRDYLNARPFPHFEAAPDQPGLICKIDEDGTRTIGRFVNREFVAVER